MEDELGWYCWRRGGGGLGVWGWLECEGAAGWGGMWSATGGVKEGGGVMRRRGGDILEYADIVSLLAKGYAFLSSEGHGEGKVSVRTRAELIELMGDYVLLCTFECCRSIYLKD